MQAMTTPNAIGSRSARAVETLHRVDPQFQTLCKMLYGPGVDAETVWRDVFTKNNPDQADLATARRQNVERRVAQASNVLGLTAGTAALGVAARDPRLAGTKVHAAGTRIGNSAPAKGVMRRLEQVGPKKLAGAALGLQAANVGGDVITSRVLGRSERKGKLHPVARKPMAAHQAGRRDPRRVAKASARKDLPNVGHQGHLKDTPAYKSGKAAMGSANGAIKAVRRGFAEATKTKGRKMALGGGALLYTGAKLGERRQNVTYDGPDYYAKRDEPVDVVFSGEFAKLDTDQRLAFGWASVTEINGLPVVDKQADYVSTDDVEKAAYDYVLRSRVGGDMHKRAGAGESPHKVSDLVESFVITDEKVAKMGLPESTPRGWWVGFKIHDEDAWQMVKKGERTGFSIHGRGRRQEVDTDSIMGYAR